MTIIFPRILPIALLAGFFTPLAGSENWPRFHGPNGSGVSTETRISAEWTDDSYRWRIDLPGIGHGSPVVWGDIVIGTCGFTANPKHCVAVRLNGDKELEEVWRIERNVPHIPSVVVVGEHCYLWDDAGIVTCVEAATGRELWKGRVPGVEGPCMGSPVSDGERIFSADESGNIHVIAVSADELKVLARNSLGDLCRSTPAIGDGAFFVRTVGKLFAIEGGKAD